MFRKSQAALEFLTTYAWAFLVIIIMVGALAYFGVLSPSKLLPDRCNFGSEISCNKDLLVVKKAATNTIQMKLKSNFGTQVTIPRDTIVLSTDIDGLTCALFKLDEAVPPVKVTKGTGAVDLAWDSDKTLTLVVDCSNGDTKLIPKEKVKFNFEITYYPTTAGIAYQKKVFGELFTTVQP